MTDDEAKMLMRLVTEMHAKIMASPTPAARSTTATVAEVAPDSELDGKYGDPEIRHDPKRWNGISFKGKHFSEAPPEWLDEMASFKDWAAGQDAAKGTPETDKKAHYNRLDAARARGWAARKRAGWKSTKVADAFDPDNDSDLPF